MAHKGLIPVILVALAGVSFAQSLPQLDIRAPRIAEAFRSPDLRVDVDLVLLPVTVTNRSGALVNGLTPSSFTVLEDNNPKPIVSFGSEDMPCSVGVVVDISGSMAGKTAIAAGAMRAFFDTANPSDEAFLLTVSTRPDTLSGFTDDFGNLESQLSWHGRAGPLHWWTPFSWHSTGCGEPTIHVVHFSLFPTAWITTAATQRRSYCDSHRKRMSRSIR